MALNDHVRGAIRDPGRDPVLDRLYAESAREEPPARLDAAIRAAARRAVGARPRSLGSIVRAWRMPVSVAAILVLSASLVLLMKEEGADRLDYASPPAVLQPEVAEDAQPDALRSQASRVPEGATSKRAAEPAPPTAPAREAQTAGRERSAPGARNDLRRQTESVVSGVEPTPGPPAASAKERRPAPLPEPAAQPPKAHESTAIPREADVGHSAAGRALHSERAAPTAAPPPAKPVAQGEAVARRAEPEPGARGSSDHAAQGRYPQPEAGAPLADARPPAKPMTAPRPLAKPAPFPAEPGTGALASRAPIWSGFERQPPDKWVAYIEELRRAGREAEAREMLEELRKRFPDYPLPASLAR